ncbi:hypothetical protein WJ978_17480 [Achromobacter xylosoxidans]
MPAAPPCATTCRKAGIKATPARKADASISKAMGNCCSKRRTRRRRNRPASMAGARNAATPVPTAAMPLAVSAKADIAASSANVTAQAQSRVGSTNRNSSVNRRPASRV